MFDISLDPSVQERINYMLIRTTDPSAQEETTAIFQEVSQIPEFPIYLFQSISNPQIGVVAQTTAANILRHLISKIPIAFRKFVKENSSQILQPCFASQEVSFVNSVSALVAEIVREFGIAVFPDLNNTVAGLFINETTFLSGLSLVFELALQDVIIEGEYIAHLPELTFSEEFAIAFEAVQCIEVLSNRMKAAIKEACVLPILSNESVSELDETILVKIIVSIGNLISAEEEEVSEEEKGGMLEFIKACIGSENDSLAVPAMAVYQENPMPFDEELCQCLYAKLSKDEDINEGEVSQQCKYLLTTILENDPEPTSAFLFQAVQENIGSEDLGVLISTIRTLSFLSAALSDVSEVFPALISKLEQGVPPQIKAETALCIAEMCTAHTDIAPKALEALMPLINDEDENVRKQSMIAVTGIFEITEFSANDTLPFFINAFPRISTTEGSLILDALASCVEQCSDLGESESLQAVLETVVTVATEAPDNEPAFVSSITVLEKCLTSCASVLQPIFECEGLITKLMELLSNEERELPEIQFTNEEEDVGIAGTSYDTSAGKIVNFISAALKAEMELEIDTFNEFFMQAAQIAVAIIQRNDAYLLTRIASWEYLSVVLKALPFDELAEGVIQAGVEESGVDNDDDLLGNIAFLFYSLLQMAQTEGKVVKAILLNMSNGIKNATDDLDMKNMACCIMVCLTLLQAPNVESVPDNPEDTDQYLQYAISLMIEDEETPEEIKALCAQFRIEE